MTTVYVAGFLVAEQHVALITKAKPDWQRGRLNGIGGKVEPGEGYLDAMVREFHEETALHVPAELWRHRVMLGKAEWTVHFYVAEIERRAALRGSDEEPVAWYPIAGLPSNVIYNLHWLIPLCLDTSIVGPVRVTHV